jgi:hypothetical protein
MCIHTHTHTHTHTHPSFCKKIKHLIVFDKSINIPPLSTAMYVKVSKQAKFFPGIKLTPNFTPTYIEL